MIKKTITICLIFASTLVLSHEFWISPSSFFPKINDVINLKAFVGEDYVGERWGGGSRRVEQFKIHNSEQWLPLTVNQSDSAVQLPDYKIKNNGTHVFTLQTNSSFIELEAKKFEDYLKEDGLENALEYRQKHNESQKNGRELYRRCAKTMLQVGPITGYDNGIASRRSDMILDIKPLRHPYSLTKNESLRCQFRYDDADLKNQMVRCWRRVDGKTEVEFKQTNNQGIAIFDLPKKGTGVYMISTVTMVRLENNPKADWQSTWGSLTFAIR